MTCAGLLLVALFPTVITGGTLQDRAIKAYLQELTEKDINDAKVIEVVDIILAKVEDDDRCIRMIESTCTARLENNETISVPAPSTADRIAREVSSTKLFLKNFISNLAQKHYPKVLSMVKNVLSNKTSGNFNDKFSNSADLILLKSVSKVNDALDTLVQYKAPVITVMSLILMLTMILIFACMSSACQDLRAKRRASKAAKLERYWRRRQEAHELN